MPKTASKAEPSAGRREPGAVHPEERAQRQGGGRSGKINLRVTPDRLDLIDRAAGILGKTRTDFILDTAAKAAEDAILDQRVVMLDPETYAFFIAELDRSPRHNPGLAKLLARKAPWEA